MTHPTRSTIISLAALSLAGCAAARVSHPSPSIERFTLTIGADPADTLAPVTLRLDLPPRVDSVVVLQLPSEYVGRSKLYENVVGLRALSTGARLEPTADPDKVRLIVSPNRPASVAWRLRTTLPSSSSADAHNFSDIGRGVAQLIGIDAFVLPQVPSTTPVEMRLRFALPAGAGHAATSFGPPRGPDSSIIVRESAGAVRRALYTFAVDSSALRERRITVGAGNLTVLLRGHQSIPDSVLIAGVQRVISVERAFWQSAAPAEYLVSIGVAPRGGLGGQGLSNAFEADIDSMRTMDAGVLELFAHEMMHQWIGSGRMRASPRVADGSLSWFTEGFDDFETHRVMHAAGLLNDSAYIARVNKVIVDHALSPVRDSSADAIRAGRWNDGSMQREQYLRGELLAYRLNAAVERVTQGAQSLDSLLKRMYRSAKGEDSGYTRDRLVQELGAVIGTDVARREIDRTINGGEIDLPAGALGACVEASTESRPRWDPGFDIDASLASKRTTRVRPNGPAAIAGMRDSMPIVGVSIYHGDTSKPIQLSVRTDSGVVKLRYSPQGEKVPTQQWRLRTGCRTSGAGRSLGLPATPPRPR